MLTAKQVADYFLASQGEGTGERISNLKLQKLCYYAQGISLALHDEPLFTEQIRAWEHGPVIPAVWHAYKENTYYSIPKSDIDPATYPPEVREVLDLVIQTYGMQSARTLRAMTHEEEPWQTAWHRPEKLISRQALTEFFKKRVPALLATDGRPRPLEKTKLREILRADRELEESTRIGLEDFEAGRYEQLD